MLRCKGKDQAIKTIENFLYSLFMNNKLQQFLGQNDGPLLQLKTLQGVKIK